MDKENKRLLFATLMGGVLGVFCVIGVSLRIGFHGNEWFLFAMWYNRVIMGLLIGFSGNWGSMGIFEDNLKNSALRGAILGTLVTSAIAFSTEFRDLPSWFAGIGYGVIIDLLSTYVTEIND